MTRHGSAATLRWAAALLALAAAISGCSSGVEANPAPTSDLTELIDSYLGGADAASYSEDQVAVLERASSSGVLTFEDYSAAIRSALDCVVEAGFYVDEDAPDMSRGFLTINYFYESPEAGNPVAEACILRYSAAVESVYQLQPVSTEAEGAVRLASHAEVLACLTKMGADSEVEELTAADLTVEEFDARLGRLIIEAGRASKDRALAIAACDSASDA